MTGGEVGQPQGLCLQEMVETNGGAGRLDFGSTGSSSSSSSSSGSSSSSSNSPEPQEGTECPAFFVILHTTPYGPWTPRSTLNDQYLCLPSR